MSTENNILSEGESPWRKATQRFYEELPTLLRDPAKFGRWVGYSADGQIAEDVDELIVLRECERQCPVGTFAVGRVVPVNDEIEFRGEIVDVDWSRGPIPIQDESCPGPFIGEKDIHFDEGSPADF